jgi:hypothetical protein
MADRFGNEVIAGAVATLNHDLEREQAENTLATEYLRLRADSPMQAAQLMKRYQVAVTNGLARLRAKGESR